MKVIDLREVSSEYQDNINEWQFLKAAYTGAKALVDYGVIQRHERESADNYNNRKYNAFGFSYSRAIANLFNYYLFSRPIDRILESLGDNEQWQMFTEDCDLEGTNFDQFFQSKMAEVIAVGQYGLLVDKSPMMYSSQASEIKAKVYPYVAAYSSENILDWTFERDENNRPFLAYLKLKDDVTNKQNNLIGYQNGTQRYRLWWKDKWEVWVEPDTEDGVAAESSEAELESEGINHLGEIPFIWLYNQKTSVKGVGVSDITDISRIDVSIMRNLSQGEEIIDYSAFPMMRKPKVSVDSTDEVGVKAVLEFDPDTPESKPDWLEAKCLEPINALLVWMDKKVQEVYRVANTGGINATETQSQAKSGAALQIEFRMLNALLVNKANNLKEAQERVIYYWLEWQNLSDLFMDVSLKAPESFDVENLNNDLENVILSKSIISSELFSKAIQKRVMRKMLPEVSDEELGDIDDEIDSTEMMEYTPFQEENGEGEENDNKKGDHNIKEEVGSRIAK